MAALPDDDGLAPPLARAQPEWIADLLLLAKKDFGKLPSEQAEAFLKQVQGNLVDGRSVCLMPLGMMDMAQSAIPGCWPLKGTVMKAKTHWYEARLHQDFRFPPADKMLHVAFFGQSVLIGDLGKLQRENCDVLFLAWLLRYSEALQAKDGPTIDAMKKAAGQCACTLHRRACEDEKLAAAYQLVVLVCFQCAHLSSASRWNRRPGFVFVFAGI